MMQFSEYPALAMRTCKIDQDHMKNVIHMVLGLNSEYQELGEAVITEQGIFNVTGKANNKEQIKEIGDNLWFLAGLCHFEGYDFSRGHDFEKYLFGKSLDIITGAYKANWIYQRDMNTPDKTGNTPRKNVQDAIYSIIMNLDELCHDIAVTLGECMERNIAKLQQRYPEAYSDYAANNKNEEVE